MPDHGGAHAFVSLCKLALIILLRSQLASAGTPPDRCGAWQAFAAPNGDIDFMFCFYGYGTGSGYFRLKNRASHKVEISIRLVFKNGGTQDYATTLEAGETTSGSECLGCSRSEIQYVEVRSRKDSDRELRSNNSNGEELQEPQSSPDEPPGGERPVQSHAPPPSANPGETATERQEQALQNIHAEQQQTIQSVGQILSTASQIAPLNLGADQVKGEWLLGFGVAGIAGYGRDSGFDTGGDLMFRRLFWFLRCRVDGDQRRCSGGAEVRADAIGSIVFATNTGGNPNDGDPVKFRILGDAIFWYDWIGALVGEEWASIWESHENTEVGTSYWRTLLGPCVGQNDQDFRLDICAGAGFAPGRSPGYYGWARVGASSIFGLKFMLEYEPAPNTPGSTAASDWEGLLLLDMGTPW